MLHNDNIENGMLKFWEKVTDEETGETWEKSPHVIVRSAIRQFMQTIIVT